MGKVPGLKREHTSAHLVTSLLIKNSSIADLWKTEILGIMDPEKTKSKEEKCSGALYEDTKSGVASLKNITIPRLKILACCIRAPLTSSIRKAMNLEDIPSLYWTDFSTNLYWIQHENHWGTFVKNRVEEIRNLSPREAWKHLPGELVTLLISHHVAALSRDF
ncbi:uncharacterized protein TNCV_3084331 [Trichonephila clavipes]|nr:uncharacterized protein TNCV_3084331 [Trichonephila clavipes]